jgi:hypothetical protein
VSNQYSIAISKIVLPIHTRLVGAQQEFELKEWLLERDLLQPPAAAAGSGNGSSGGSGGGSGGSAGAAADVGASAGAEGNNSVHAFDLQQGLDELGVGLYDHSGAQARTCASSMLGFLVRATLFEWCVLWFERWQA